MKYLLITSAIIVIMIISYFVRKGLNKKNTLKHSALKVSSKEELFLEEYISYELLTEADFDNSIEMVEVKDNEIIKFANMMVPSLLKIGQNIKQIASQEQIVRVILPNGEKLAKVAGNDNRVRGFFRTASGIKGHAEFVDLTEVEKLKNVMSSAMSIISITVGLYYMAEIDSKLSNLNEKVNEIRDFQDDEYKSKIYSLISHVQQMTNHSEEILSNDELRRDSIAKLDLLETECTQLLDHAIVKLNKIPKWNNISFAVYNEGVEAIELWNQYQEVLLNILKQIASLKYTLYNGEVSRTFCNSHVLNYGNKIQENNEHLKRWHYTTMESLEIDHGEKTRRRENMDALVHYIPGLLNDEYNYTKVDDQIIELINKQIGLSDKKLVVAENNYYEDDVELIIKEGKVYYLPNNKIGNRRN